MAGLLSRGHIEGHERLHCALPGLSTRCPCVSMLKMEHLWDRDCSCGHGWASVYRRLSRFTDDGLGRLLVLLMLTL